MTVAIQPCGDKKSRAHYTDTLLNPVLVDEIIAFLDEDKRSHLTSVIGGYVGVWGVTPGVNGVNNKKWLKLSSGDLVLFYRDKQIFSQARILMCVHNSQLAQKLWGSDEAGETWEYIYFLHEMQEIEIPVDRYNEVMGYKENYIVQGFNVFEGEKEKAILDLLEVKDFKNPSYTFSSIDYDTTREKLANIQIMTTTSKSKSRAEAPIMRQYLFGGVKEKQCDLCGKVFPVGLLVAAHIKKRASCSNQEKADPNVVMKACKLGCDELYERGYIYVDDEGVVRPTDELEQSSLDLIHEVKKILGGDCLAFNEKTKLYFEWHRKHLIRLA